MPTEANLGGASCYWDLTFKTLVASETLCAVRCPSPCATESPMPHLASCTKGFHCMDNITLNECLTINGVFWPGAETCEDLFPIITEEPPIQPWGACVVSRVTNTYVGPLVPIPPCPHGELSYTTEGESCGDFRFPEDCGPSEFDPAYRCLPQGLTPDGTAIVTRTVQKSWSFKGLDSLCGTACCKDGLCGFNPRFDERDECEASGGQAVHHKSCDDSELCLDRACCPQLGASTSCFEASKANCVAASGIPFSSSTACSGRVCPSACCVGCGRCIDNVYEFDCVQVNMGLNGYRVDSGRCDTATDCLDEPR